MATKASYLPLILLMVSCTDAPLSYSERGELSEKIVGQWISEGGSSGYEFTDRGRFTFHVWNNDGPTEFVAGQWWVSTEKIKIQAEVRCLLKGEDYWEYALTGGNRGIEFDSSKFKVGEAVANYERKSFETPAPPACGLANP